MRRAFVSLPDGVWKIIDRDYKGQIGEGDSEVIRSIVISYLSDRGYFINAKGEPMADELRDRTETLEDMLVSLAELLEEKGELNYSQWETRMRNRIQEKTAKRHVTSK